MGGFVVDLALIAGGLMGLLVVVAFPRGCLVAAGTLLGGYAGHEVGGILGTLAGLLVGWSAAEAIAAVLASLFRGVRWTWRRATGGKVWRYLVDSWNSY